MINLNFCQYEMYKYFWNLPTFIGNLSKLEMDSCAANLYTIDDKWPCSNQIDIYGG